MRVLDLAIVLREDGPRWLAWRLWYEVQLRQGFVRSLPARERVDELLAESVGIAESDLDNWLASAWAERRGSFFPEAAFQGAASWQMESKQQAVDDADRILAGELRYFSRQWRSVGSPPDWFGGETPASRWPSDVHWSRISDLSSDAGDIKWVWEAARFGYAFTLARAYTATGDERYPEAFWMHVESWLDANRPEMGPHWRCAQEMALRCMAWTFGLYTFQNSSSSTPARIARLIKSLWYHAWHIEKVHWYAAECVRNNHAISEAAGLFTIGLLLPFLPDAKRWQEKGLAQVTHEASWQVYDDGSYVQHSMNYSRLVVQLFSWTLGLARANQVEIPVRLKDRASRLLRFMRSMQDDQSGRVPNYGSNDGALIIPLSSCDYLDYRPGLGALSVALGEPFPYGVGPWEEEAAWLAGRAVSAATGPIREIERSHSFPDGGYYLLRGDATHAMVRCTTYRHRPAQADMLHLDVWYHGHNVLVDPGTYSYNLKPPWAGHFTGTSSHNTVTIDGRDQMRKGSRFMWLNWTKGRLVDFRRTAGYTRFQGEHSGYGPVTHRRTVVLQGGVYMIIDDLQGGESEHIFRLHWLVNDYPLTMDKAGASIGLPGSDQQRLRLTVIADGATLDWARGDEQRVRGWQSQYYGERTAAWSLQSLITGRSGRFVTVLGPEQEVSEMVQSAGSDWNQLLAKWTTGC